MAKGEVQGSRRRTGDFHRDHGDESHAADVAVEQAHAIRLADDPDCICGGGFTVHEANAGGHSSSCPLWGQTWDEWPS